MADYGHDPTETAVPFKVFKEAGCEIAFATENGKTPECDAKMLTGWTQKLLGANQAALDAHSTLIKDPSYLHPLSWSSPSFSLASYSLVFFPGGHEKGVRQIIDSPRVHDLVRDHFPNIKKPSTKGIVAICHGVMVLSETLDGDGKSVIRECDTTALVGGMENFAFWGTRLILGDYYKTYGAGSENVEDSVKKRLNNPKQFKSSMASSPFVVQDEKYNYISGRFPPDAQLLAERALKMVS